MKEDLTKLNSISSSKYDIYSKLLDLAASGEYITPLNQFENTDFLKSGLFGYVTESLALMMRDSSFHKTMVYRENFLNTAIMPKSIYNWAKMFNINVLDAIPSARKATIAINISTIDSIISNTQASVSSFKEKYGIAEPSNFMVIDKSNPIIAGSYYFMLEHSIEIYKTTNNQYVVKYCLNEKEKTTEFGSYSNGGLLTAIRKNIKNQTYLYFDALVFQYKPVEKTKIISGSSFLDAKVHQFDISGQICGMSLTYQKSNQVENVELKFSNIDIAEDAESNKKIAYYSIIDKDKIEISFLANTTNGLPQSGGSLKLKAFITEGFNGNVNFTGDAVFLINQEDIKTFPISVQLSKSPIMAGLDQTSLGEIKNTIISKLATRNTIITENDLNTWFATQSKLLASVNNSKITFRKEVDTLLKRTFSAYLLLRDGVQLSEYLTKISSSDNSGQASDVNTITSIPSSYISSVVPTNTVDVEIKPTDNPNSSIILLNFNNTIYYDNSTESYICDSNNSSINSEYTYRTPFFIKLDLKYNTLSYFYMETADSSDLEYSELKNQNNNLLLIPMSADVFHENTTNSKNYYKFKFYFNTDEELTASDIKEITLTFDLQTIKLDDSTKDWTIEKINNSNDKNNTINTYAIVINGEWDPSNGISDQTENPQIQLNFGNNSISTYEDSKIKINLKFANDNFNGEFQTVKKLSIFKSLNDIMSSEVLIKNSGDETKPNNTYVIKDVPVVAKYWLSTSINKTWFIKQLFVFINMLKSNLERLETTTFFNIKFRNTYGISQYFTSTSTMLRLKLKIYLKDSAINQYKGNLTTGYNTRESLENEIRDFIRVAVDKSNDDGALIISKIIMQTQAAYINFIDHIDFLGLNGTFNQYVKNIENKISDKTYPLEYFSLDNTIETDDNGVSNVSRLTKDITFEII